MRAFEVGLVAGNALTLLPHSPAHGPCTCGKSDRSVRLLGEGSSQPRGKATATILIQRTDIRRGRSSPPEERLPVVIKARELCGDGLCVANHIGQAGALEQTHQLVGATDRESPSFIKIASSGVFVCRRIPESPQEPHPFCVVPHARRNCSAGDHKRTLFCDGGVRVRKEIQCEERSHTLIAVWVARKSANTSHHERGAMVEHVVPGVFDE